MSTVKLRYVGGLEHVDVPILSREGEPLDEHGEGCLVRGEVFTCDKKVAGRAPQLDEAGALALDEHGQIVDAGEGLLAQPSNFEVAGNEPPPVKKTAKKKPGRRPRKKTAEKPKPDPSPPMPSASPGTASDENAEV